jgi:hypothetical protein
MPTHPGKKRGVPAVIERFQRQWRARYTNAEGVIGYLTVTNDDAWNFDIEHCLPVVVKLLPDGSCKILSRKGNKKFITIHT